jgi:CheY-like chemotaxis protein/DNA-binding XRE family transcriptional regulator
MISSVPKGPHHSESDAALQARLGAAIRACRHQLKITQEDLAERADMHRTYVADIERGARNATLRSIASLADALRISIASLMSRAGEGEFDGEPLVPAQGPRAPGEILMVEDSPTDAELALAALKQAKLTNPIHLVSDGRQALDYLIGAGTHARRRRARLPQLVLLDLDLPKISGLEVLRRIQANRRIRDIPVVALADSKHSKEIDESLRLGAVDYLVKPVGFDNLSRITPKLNLQWALVKPTASALG